MELNSSDGCKRSSSDVGFSENSPKRKTTEQDEKSKEEEYFSKLIQMVYDTVTRLKEVKEEDVDEALKIMKLAFCSFSFQDLNLSEWKNSCAYFRFYGPHGAGLTRCRVLEAMQKCQDLTTKFKKPDANIISLGGGPGNDIIGLCSALDECKAKISLDICVIDSFKEWSLFMILCKLYILEGNFGNVSEFFQSNNINWTFIPAKLPGSHLKDKKYIEFLMKADIILMTKLLSTAWNDKKDIIQSIYNDMKDDALILCIDSPFEEDWWTHFEVLYLSESGEEHYYRPSISDKGPEKSKARIAVLRKRIYDKTQ